MLGLSCFLQAYKAHVTLPQTIVFTGTLLWICSDDNGCTYGMTMTNV